MWRIKCRGLFLVILGSFFSVYSVTRPSCLACYITPRNESASDCSFVLGPQHWADKHLKYQPGHRQSPIDILTDRVSSDPKLWRNPLKWSYPKRTAGLENTGYLWKAVLPADGSFLRGGPLDHDYELEQFHCHWGSENSAGSEHLVDGESYAAEVPFNVKTANWRSYN